MPAFNNGRVMPRKDDIVSFEYGQECIISANIPGVAEIEYRKMRLEIGVGEWSCYFKYDWAAQKWFPVSGAVLHKYGHDPIELK